VHEASLQDHNGGKDLLAPLKGRFSRLKLIWADSGYKKGGFVEWVELTLGWEVEIVEHPWSGLRGVWVPEGGEVNWEQIRPKGFRVLKWRWIVERTFAWKGVCSVVNVRCSLTFCFWKLTVSHASLPIVVRPGEAPTGQAVIASLPART
jgi:transposase